MSKYEEFLQQGMSIHNGTQANPDSMDDKGIMIPLVKCIRMTGIDRSTWLAHIKKKPATAEKLDGGRQWWVRLKFMTFVILHYRYGRLGMRTGKWWTKKELEILDQPISHREASHVLNRSYGAVKVKRSKLCNHMN